MAKQKQSKEPGADLYLRISPELKDRAKGRAKKGRLSLNSHILNLIETDANMDSNISSIN